MSEKARIAVIGGGITGCATLYYLTQQGCTDALLIEKGELTSGSTWHAAGQVPFYSSNPFFSRIQKLSFDTFEQVQDQLGESVGLHKCGSLRLGYSEEELLEYRRFAAFAPHLGIETEVIGPNAAREMFPYFEGASIAGALYVPTDGYTDAAQTTNAFAKASRLSGAKILRHTRVEAILRRPGGGWRIKTTGETVEADMVVNCAGAWAGRISSMVGGRLPVCAIEHQYFVTDSLSELNDRTDELPILRNLNVPYYIRQEGNGFLVSAYENETLYWGGDAPCWDFDQALLPPDLDRAMPFIEATMADIPILSSLGVKSVVNGPTPRCADLNPLVGPAHGYSDFFVMTGVAGGFVQCGTAKYLAEWILNGAPSEDLSPVDVRRFGDYATQAYTRAKLDVSHTYSGSLFYPHSESSAARGARHSAAHAQLADKGAVFGACNGWEIPNWFAPEHMDPMDRPSYRRANWFGPVGTECRGVRDAVGVIDLSSLTKLVLSGPEAEAVLGELSANRVPKRSGDMSVTPVVNGNNGIDAWFLATRMGTTSFLLTSSANCEQRDFDLLQWLTSQREVRIDNATESWGILAIAGPRAGALLTAVSGVETDLTTFPYFTAREISIAFTRVRAQRCSLTGEDGFELFARPSAIPALYDYLHATGGAMGLFDFGHRALESLRLEAGLPRFGVEIGTHTSPADAGVGRFLRIPKVNGTHRLTSMLLTDSEQCQTSDPWGGEGVLIGNETIGITCSGGFGHTIEKRIANAWLPIAHTRPGTALNIDLLGERIPASVAMPPFHKRPR